MRYHLIRKTDVANGEGIGVALFVQGCHFHCKGCFNPETWDFNGGKEWTPEVEDKFIELASRPYIKRISLLGGECLAEENLDGVLNLVNKIRLLMPEKTIWLYTGYRIKEMYNNNFILSPSAQSIINTELDYKVIEESIKDKKRSEIISQCNVVVDGRYIDSQRNISAKWKGSDNQRVIDIKKSLEQNEIVLYCD